MKTEFDSLCRRFISDNNLQFQFVDYNHFNYCINLFGKKHDWDALLEVIKERFDNNPNKFLDEYYQLRDKIITDFLDKKEYKFFNEEMNLNDFALDKDSRNITSNNIYNRENLGKTFLSIDLKKANFQTMKHISSSMVNNRATYEDFIGDYTDLDYIKNSKYTRQVVFGKLNPKRQITCEKFFTNEIRKLIETEIYAMSGKIVSMSNDELVYEITTPEKINDRLIQKLVEKIKSITDFTVHADLFKLNGYEFQCMETGVCKFTFFEKVFSDGSKKLISVPMPFYKMVYKLMNNIPLEDEDYLFEYDKNVICMFIEEFQIEKINKL